MEAAIETGERQILEQARHAHIEHGMIEPCRLPGEGAGQPRLAGSGLAGDDQVLMGLQPFTLGERHGAPPVEPARLYMWRLADS